MSEIDAVNPNHPVVKELSEQWHKLCAIVLTKLGVTDIDIFAEDIERFTERFGEQGAIVANAKRDRITLRLVDGVEARQLARKAGGLPT